MTTDRSLRENDIFKNNDDDRFVYYYNIPSLKEIASYQIARVIWYSYISKCRAPEEKKTNKINFSSRLFELDTYYYKGKGEQDDFFRDALHLNIDYTQNVEKLLENLDTGVRIKKALKHFLDRVGQELKDWVEHFRDSLFPPSTLLRRQYRIYRIDPNWCVWLMNGEIDYRNSAKNAINYGGLTAAQKFLIMSEYCMEDVIQTFSLDSLPKEFVEQADFERDSIRFYWICYLQNELRKISIGNHVSADLSMAMNFRKHSRFANEYFLSRLTSDDDRVKIVINWITSKCPDSKHKRDCTILERIISTMTRYQQRHLLAQTYDTIAIYFSIHSNASQCALWAWRTCKDQMAVELFAEFLGELLLESRTATSAFLLNKIWDTASGSQRHFVVYTKLEEFIDRLLLGDYHFPSVSEFFSKFFRLISTDDKKKLMFERADQFPYSDCDPDSCSLLANICLPGSDDLLKFKKSAIDSGHLGNCCEDLFRRRCFEKLNHKLEFYFSHDATAAQVFKRQLLMDVSTKWKYLLVSRDIFTGEWKKLSDFIDETFENDLSSGLNVKRQFISTLACNLDLLNYSLVRCGFDNLLKVVEMVFANDDLKMVKRSFSYFFRRLLAKRKVSSVCREVEDEIFNNKFMKWCSADDADQLIIDDEKRVSHDVTFDRIRTRSNVFFFSTKIFLKN